MKRILLLMFILPSLFAEHMIPIENDIINFGIINFNGYRSHIFSTGLDRKVINIPDYKLSKVHCNTGNYMLVIKPLNNISYLIGMTKERQLNLFEWGLNFNNITFKSINIHSESDTGNDQLINHSLFVKHEAFISTGAGLVLSLSPMHKRGYKSLLHMDYSNDLLNILLLYESNRYYITPLNRVQDDGWRTRSSFTIKPLSWLNTEYRFIFQVINRVIKTENCFKLEINFPYNNLKMDTTIKEKDNNNIKKSHFIQSITLKSDIFKFTNTFNFELNYINALFYKGFNKIAFKAFGDSLAIDLKYSWLYIKKADHFFSTSIKYDRKDWSFTLKYKTPLIRETKKWVIEGTLKQKF